MAIIVQDSFNRANNSSSLGVADSGQAWSSDGFGISSNQAIATLSDVRSAQLNTGVSDNFQASVESIWRNYSGILFRGTNSTSFYMARLNTSQIGLFRVENGNTTSLASYPYTATSGTLYNLKAIVKGSNISIRINDVELINFTETNPVLNNGTFCGLRTYNDTLSTYDNFKVETIESGTTPDPVTYTKSLSDSIGTSEIFTKQYTGYISLSDVITSTDSISKQLSVAVVDTVNSSENFNTSGGNSLNVNDQITVLDSISKSLSKVHNDSVNTSETDQETVIKELLDSIGQSDSVTINEGKAVILNDGLLSGDSISKALSRLQTDSVTLTDTLSKQSNVSLRLYDVIVTTDIFDIFNPNAPELIGTIDLFAKRLLNVYLVAKRELYIDLKGGLNVTAENQNFEMYQGDTKNIRFPIEDESLNPVGANVKWVLTPFRKSESILTKTSIDGISIVDGKVVVKLLPAGTETLNGLYEHEVQIVDEYGNVSTVLRGKITIKEDKIN